VRVSSSCDGRATKSAVAALGDIGVLGEVAVRNRGPRWSVRLETTARLRVGGVGPRMGRRGGFWRAHPACDRTSQSRPRHPVPRDSPGWVGRFMPGSPHHPPDPSGDPDVPDTGGPTRTPPGSYPRAPATQGPDHLPRRAATEPSVCSAAATHQCVATFSVRPAPGGAVLSVLETEWEAMSVEAQVMRRATRAGSRLS